MERMLFDVVRDGVVIAYFAHIDHAELFAETLSGHVTVRSKGDGYIYWTNAEAA